MSKMITIVFPSESAASDGLNALRDLHMSGDITVYTEAVLHRDADGKVSVRQQEDDGPVGTAVGLLAGGLIGLLAGPAGALAGMGLGGLAGSLSDLSKSGVDVTYADDVAAALQPGSSAIIAEIDEDWAAPLDNRMDDLGAVVIRAWRGDVEDDQWLREAEAEQRELDQLQREYDQARAEDRAAIQAKIDAGKQKLADLKAKSKERVDQAKAEAKAKADRLAQQVKDADSSVRGKLENRVEKIRTDAKDAEAKIKARWDKVKEEV